MRKIKQNKTRGLKDQYRSTRTSGEWTHMPAYLLLYIPGLPWQECTCSLASLDFHIQNYLGGEKHTIKHKEVKKMYLAKNWTRQQESSHQLWRGACGPPALTAVGHLHCSKIKSHLAWIEARSLKPDLQSSAAICIKWLNSCPIPRSVCNWSLKGSDRQLWKVLGWDYK